MEFDLPFIWAAVIAFAVLAYVILDGFDLGVGILFPFFKEKHDRDVMMNSVAPVWDGNETWLVLGGGGLLAVFPLAYATILPALYIPLTAMLLGLIFRGVAFEYRWRTKRGEFLWDISFAGGSMVAAFSQGVALGALVQGIPVENRAYTGGWWDWLTPFSVATGLALLIGYALLGATWLVMKTSGPLSERARALAMRSGVGTLASMGVFSLWTPFLEPAYLDRWFGWPTIAFSLIVPALLLACFFLLIQGLRTGHDTRPFAASLGLFVLGFAGIGISFYPYIVPTSVTIWEAAAPDESLSFLLVGALVLVPMILAYTAYAYWVFRGKVDPEEGYH
ncbi:cytochrome d ubiquinol oxidase subunit II [Shinella sumterensis]|jgi:cytochrome bd ubiquinol oxidase subunit II|uniref:Cytochrome bd-I ubiquinol oxidase subunit 2 apoprotein n=1 Tax=Rhizobium subbaraonis TaxID=908946 RepID=A0A285UTT0_9HYPH|nr:MULTISPECIES: cytochrome d ubiquinol oxidase subunit II [Rhizobiaceae]MCW5711712.1 cytochrome d ubiquinol oxidase subunit II [Shinella sp.]WLS08762.1 cytochrome d ubiquinol oxidase subunit II [Shinella sumterensis]SOC44778.1 cytochrome bd-I ubiquinol oxidase subunit 2 apoprotein [Rhizobium subbaraonis]